MSVPARVERIYAQFARYPCPEDLWVCEQCGPSATTCCGTSPRLMELMLTTRAPVFDFRLADVADRLRRWSPDELTVVRQLAEAVWQELLLEYPCELGYFSDARRSLTSSRGAISTSFHVWIS